MAEKADLSKLRIEIAWHDDMWQEIKDSAMFTVHKSTGKYPTTDWKRRMLLAEHSPTRVGRLIVNVYNIPSFVAGHFVRHNVGFTPFVDSRRDDRADYDEVPNRNTLINMRFDGNFQTFINISRRRFCNSAHKDTIYIWKKIMESVKEFEPELHRCCVRECVYRGWCYEYPNGCGYHLTDAYNKELNDYREDINGWGESYLWLYKKQ